MNFLKGHNVRLLEQYYNRASSTPVLTDSEYEQSIHVDMAQLNSPVEVSLRISYDINHRAPKKISVSAIQDAKNPFEIEITMGKYLGRKPYETVKMEGLRTIVEVKPTTTIIIFSIPKAENEGKVGDIKFSVNYVEF